MNIADKIKAAFFETTVGRAVDQGIKHNSLRRYQDSTDANLLLWRGEWSESLAELKKAAKNIINVCELMKPTEEDLTVFRGTKAQRFEEILSADEIAGQTVTLNGITSTSRDQKVAQRFCAFAKEGLIFKINLPKGSPAVDVENLKSPIPDFSRAAKEFSDEKEILLPPAAYTVKGIERIHSSANIQSLCATYAIVELEQKELIDIYDLIIGRLEGLKESTELNKSELDKMTAALAERKQKFSIQQAQGSAEIDK